ncbi:hypothetical protein DOTSEDRAFT_69370 [Dothistroma septosporum NZE10]|uniref:Uncharacterized protein n=1 Tax=Dothistroma septosporum (strain NZE10 / CBS 128990) TaxID=675120 RepID=N1PYD8_DOTSN|nr:hypothetical protein DOTSEDRAFT_69370 [Dothistroma septosporum NZE10]
MRVPISMRNTRVGIRVWPDVSFSVELPIPLNSPFPLILLKPSAARLLDAPSRGLLPSRDATCEVARASLNASLSIGAPPPRTAVSLVTALDSSVAR